MIVLSSEISELIENELKQCVSEVNIVSAFCKIGTLKQLDRCISKNVKKKLLVRFRPTDITVGATDKEIYDYCINNGWHLYLDFSVHAKTYIFDRVKCIIGSSNLTNNGLGISGRSNKEINSFIYIDDIDYSKILSLYSDAILIDDDIFSSIISSTDDEEAYHRIIRHHREINCLLPEDFPTEDTDYLDFLNLKSLRWLLDYLSKKDDKTAYFGELSSRIHDIYVKDPRPYRRDVKQQLASLLRTIKKFDYKFVEISRPNYSECVKLIKEYQENYGIE